MAASASGGAALAARNQLVGACWPVRMRAPRRQDSALSLGARPTHRRLLEPPDLAHATRPPAGGSSAFQGFTQNALAKRRRDVMSAHVVSPGHGHLFQPFPIKQRRLDRAAEPLSLGRVI